MGKTGVGSLKISMRASVAVLVIVAGMTACRPAEPTRTRKLIGVSLLTQTHAFYKDLEQAMRQEAAAKSFDLTVAACEMDPVKQASQVEDSLLRKSTRCFPRRVIRARSFLICSTPNYAAGGNA